MSISWTHLMLRGQWNPQDLLIYNLTGCYCGSSLRTLASLLVSVVLRTAAAWDQPSPDVAEVASCSPSEWTTPPVGTVSTLMDCPPLAALFLVNCLGLFVVSVWFCSNFVLDSSSSLYFIMSTCEFSPEHHVIVFFCYVKIFCLLFQCIFPNGLEILLP